VYHPRYAQGSADDGEYVVSIADGDVAPSRKVVGLADLVDHHGGSAVQENEGAARRR
jgi:hypothetical protein